MRQFDSPHDRPAISGGRGAALLVVDPSSLSLITLAGIFHSQGHRCVCARNSEAALQSLEMGPLDLIVWDVSDDPAHVLETLADLRSRDGHESVAAVLIAGSRWSGLEKKTERLTAVTRCLFKPIDPGSLLAVVEQTLLMPALVAVHRKRGTRPSRPGWLTL